MPLVIPAMAIGDASSIDSAKVHGDMARKRPARSFATIDDVRAAFPDEQSAIDFVTARRWSRGLSCPLCGNTDQERIRRLNRLGGSADPTPTNRYQCYECRRRFSFKVGTIFEQSKVPIRSWFIAIWLATNCSKGITSVILSETLGITQNSAWYLRQRLRQAAATPSFHQDMAGRRDTARFPARRSDLAVSKFTTGATTPPRLPRFKLQISFDEALVRFVDVKPSEMTSLAHPSAG